MKLIHTSDIHIDAPMTSKLDAVKARERRRELISTFRRMTEEAMRSEIGAIIIAGDLFDSEAVSTRTMDSVLGIIEKAYDVIFFYLPGNHEKDRLLSSGLKLPKNLLLFEKDWSYFKHENIVIAGRSECSADMFETLTLDPRNKNIVVLHGELADRSDAMGHIGRKEAAAQPIDYLALGHYHTYSETMLGGRCLAVYSGTPEGRGFDEAGDKGYVFLNIDDGGVRSSFAKRAERTLHIVNTDISGADREVEIENRILHAVSSIPSTDLVRIVLTGEHEPEVRRDTETLKKIFENKFYYVELKDKSRLKICAEDYKNDISLKGEFIRLVLSSDELSEDEKERIIECGIRALAGEEIA